MRKVYLIRHCAPAFPGGEKMCIGSTDLPLSEAGIAQAKQLGQTLPSVTALFSSPLRRCTQTARAFGMEITVLDGLREMDMGEWDGLTFSQIRRQYPALYAARGENPNLLPPGAEPQEEALARFRKALKEAASLAPGDFAVITHGGILALFLEEMTGKQYKPAYGEIVEILL